MNRKNDDIQKLNRSEFPELLSEIPDPPEKLFVRGKLPPPETKLLCVVGSRKYSRYGKEVCQKLLASLRGYNVSIVSGLALGIDSVAHEAALEAGLPTIAVPGSGLGWDVLYPRAHVALAERILAADGGHLSEFEPDFKARPESFPKRNRLMAGLSHATLIIEARERSGTLITARLATEYGREVATVPADIFSNAAGGSNELLREGATPITKAEDLVEVLGLEHEDEVETSSDLSSTLKDLSESERRVLVSLDEPKSKEMLLEELDLSAAEANVLLSGMEVEGFISERGGKIYRL